MDSRMGVDACATVPRRGARARLGATRWKRSVSYCPRRKEKGQRYRRYAGCEVDSSLTLALTFVSCLRGAVSSLQSVLKAPCPEPRAGSRKVDAKLRGFAVKLGFAHSPDQRARQRKAGSSRATPHGIFSGWAVKPAVIWMEITFDVKAWTQRALSSPGAPARGRRHRADINDAAQERF